MSHTLKRLTTQNVNEENPSSRTLLSFSSFSPSLSPPLSLALSIAFLHVSVVRVCVITDHMRMVTIDTYIPQSGSVSTIFQVSEYERTRDATGLVNHTKKGEGDRKDIRDVELKKAQTL
jgi:hypothetical protein